MEQDEWYDDSPMYRDRNEALAAMLGQLRPISEWLTFEEVWDVMEQLRG